MEDTLFIILAALTITGGILVVAARRIVHAAFGLLASLCGVAGLFLLCGADFLGITQILLYVGGILVLILFGILLVPTSRQVSSRGLLRLITGSTIAAAALLLLLPLVRRSLYATAPLPEAEPTVRAIGHALLATDGFLVPFELASMVLLVALVGAVRIARTRETPTTREEEAPS